MKFDQPVTSPFPPNRINLHEIRSSHHISLLLFPSPARASDSTTRQQVQNGLGTPGQNQLNGPLFLAFVLPLHSAHNTTSIWTDDTLLYYTSPDLFIDTKGFSNQGPLQLSIELKLFFKINLSQLTTLTHLWTKFQNKIKMDPFKEEKGRLYDTFASLRRYAMDII
jgi:hypothetical protein